MSSVPFENSRIDPAGIYRLSSFIDMIGISRTTWYQRMDDGKAPRPAFHISRRVAVWRGADILKWLENPVDWPTSNQH